VLLEVEVTGAASEGEATAIAKRIATSPLVKTAAFGRDPNWGRILAAAGSAFVSGGFAQLDVDRLTLRMNGVALFAKGEPTGADVPLDGPVCTIELDLALGEAGASYLASDLTYDYVKINAEYTT
jgi:glutamate N-acetyltransferase/amino-acid N-acetyltransferase